MRDRIMEYLANGVKAARVASIVGCSPGYVSQLVNDPEFKAELEAKMTIQTASSSENSLDTKYDAVEHELMDAMSEALVGAELPAITHALRTVADIRLKKTMLKNPAPANPLGAHNLTVVNVTLPIHALRDNPVVELNSQGEILAINKTNLAPLSSDGVRNLFAKRMVERGIAAKELVPTLAAVPSDF